MLGTSGGLMAGGMGGGMMGGGTLGGLGTHNQVSGCGQVVLFFMSFCMFMYM